MKAIILAAGYATRLYPLTLDLPKALLNIKGKPILEYTLRKIEEIKKIDHVCIVTNDKFYRTLHDWVEKNKNRFRLKIDVLNDNTNSNETRLGGIGDLYYCIEKKEIKEDVLILNSDNLFDFSLKPIVEMFKKRGSVMNGVYPVKDVETARRHGIVELSEDRILDFEEKPENPKTLIKSIGVYLFPYGSFMDIQEYLKKGNNKDSPGNLIKYFVDNSVVYYHIFHGRIFDIGNLDTYNRIEQEW